MLGRLNHHTLAVPFVLAMAASAMSVRESHRPASELNKCERARRNKRARIQKQSRRRNRR